MIVLHLFRASNPFQEIDSRKLAHGELVVGRDIACDWCIPDDSRDLSRRHCIIMVEGERIFLRDTSANGMTIGAEKRAAPREERCELSPGEMLHLGEFLILVDVEAEEAPRREKASPPAAAPPARPKKGDAQTDAGLLEAFCAGAALEVSSFAGEDPASVMRRLGVVYRAVVDDLCAMMRDRALVKEQFDIDRTTISARENNPMKWAPPQRVAVDLLQEGQNGFLRGADAFRASFTDLRRHGVCVMAGSDAALQFVLAQLDPDEIEEKARKQALPPFASRIDAAWRLLREVHTSLSAESGDTVIERAFRQGYERRLEAIPTEDQAA